MGLMSKEFATKLKIFLNEQGIDNEMNVPDYILAEFIQTMLSSLRGAIEKRDDWFGFDKSISGIDL